jgi:hypothetical protein
MPWFDVKASIEMEIEAPTILDAQLKAESIMSKRVIGAGIGCHPLDRGSVVRGKVEAISPALVVI